MTNSAIRFSRTEFIESQEVEARRRESEALANAGSAEALDMTGEEAYARRARMSGFSAAPGPDNGAEASSSGRQGGSGGGGLTMAQRMMQKMGWKEGQGLGKDGQGISTPLIMQKTDNNSHGVIVSGAPLAGSIPEKRRKVREAAYAAGAVPCTSAGN